MAHRSLSILLVVEMKIALINPPSSYLLNDASYPPTGLLYLAGKIEQLGHKAEIHDMSGQMPLDVVGVQDADMIGITCVTPNVTTVKQIIEWLPQIPILVGGPHPTFMVNDFLGFKPNVIPVRGEADAAISKIISDYLANALEASYTAGQPAIDEIACPARHLLDLRRYTPGGWAKSTVIYTSRGCPYSCRFCSKIQGNEFREFPIYRVEQELDQCMKLGFTRFVFGDDNIIANKPRMKALLQVLKEYNIKYRLNQDSRHLDKTVASMAADSGCIEISFGIESGSQPMLDRMHKQTTVEANKATLRTAMDAGIWTKAYLIVNFPGETSGTIDQTLTFIQESEPDSVLVSNFAPLPGSHVFIHPREYGIDWMNTDWGNYVLAGRNGVPKPTFTTKELTVEQQVANRNQLMEGLKECGY